MRRGPRQLVTVLLAVALLVTSAVAGSGLAVAQEADGESADEVYVTEDGDAVMVFQGEAGENNARGEYGLDVDEGLAYLLVESTDLGDGSVSGGMTAALTDSAMEASGNLTVPKPDQLESLAFDLEAVTTQDESRFDATLSSSIADPGGLAMTLQEATTEGSMSMSADRFQLDGQFEVDAGAGMTGPETSMSFAISEGDGTYTIDVAQDRVVSEFAAEQWETRSAAKDTIQQQFGSIAIALGGQSSVSLDSYSFSEGGDGQYRLDIEYTMTLSNIKDTLEEVLTQQLTQAGEVSEEQARQLAADLRTVTINEAAVSVETSQGTTSGSFSLDVSNYGDLLLTYFELADDLGASETSLQNLDRARASFEAQRAADLTYDLSWSGSLAVSDVLTVDAELHQTASNWQAFREELESRDLPTPSSEYELSAETDGDRLRMSGAGTYEGERIVTRFVDQAMNASDVPEDSKELLRGFERADLRKAKLDASFGEELRLQAGAKFGNMGVLREALATLEDVPALDSAVARTEDGQVNQYVRVSGAVSGDASESDVRALAGVGEDTTIHMPGSWDREFPAMDTERAGDFLDLEEDMGVEEGGDEDTASGSGPGFGPIAALIGVLALALLAVRRET
jgi:PGF-CTERM protein